MSWETVAGIVAGVLLAYAVLLFLLWLYARRHPETVTMKDALRLLPDLLRLIRRLAGDRTVAVGVRIRLVLLLAYLLSPIDLVPDFIPVIGYADDAVIVALVLRSVIKRAGEDAVRRHWPGSPAGLDIILQAARPVRRTQ
ncbi:YkvA family protein [Arthrobacter nitrophenolicus]|uniref:YkvA family protein n=1 Tax=Arthrobacter TaxID=1663 RepID=UPI00389AE8D9